MADFAFDAHRIEPEAPIWNTVSTEMEGMRKKVRLKSTKSQRKWVLYFRVQDQTERDAFLAHYNGQKGNLTPFNWTSIPAHIGSDVLYYVRYVYYKEESIAFGVWDIEVQFEEVL